MEIPKTNDDKITQFNQIKREAASYKQSIKDLRFMQKETAERNELRGKYDTHRRLADCPNDIEYPIENNIMEYGDHVDAEKGWHEFAQALDKYLKRVKVVD